MWSQYDENLCDNLFFKEIQNNHSDIIKKASSENWIICIPRTGTFEPVDVSIDTILDHILVPGLEHCYCTLSKKEISVKNKHINIDSSFTNTEILFEETFYIEKSCKYKVWCVDRPVFLKHSYCDSHCVKVLESLHDCIDFLWTESLGHGILDNIRLLVENFLHQQEDFELENLQTQKELVGKLYSQCLQISLKSEVIKEKGMKNKNFLENLKVSVETYMQYCLGRKLIFSVSTLQSQADSFLNKIIRNSSDLQFQDLNISNKFSDMITAAKCELSKMNNYLTVLDKINCLKRTFSVLYQSTETVKNICFTSDDTLQILVFIILKLCVNNWTANLTFIKEFRLSLSDNSDQNSFFITSLEAAIEFIKSNNFLEIINSINTVDSILVIVNCICDKIKSGENKDLFTNITSKHAIKQNLCHPLCVCKKCETVIEKQNNDELNLDFKNCNKEGQNLLVVAAIQGNCDVVQFLLAIDFDINFSDYIGRTSLHFAAIKGHQDVLLLLINRKANVNIVDDDKNTPLHLACINGQESCVKALIYSSGNVELNLGNFYGETPLHLATKWGYFDIVKVLLENGASVVVKNRRNQTPMNLAPNYYILKLFEDHGLQQSTTIRKDFNEFNTVVVEEKIEINDCKEHGIRPKNVEQFKKIDLLLKAIESNDLPLTCFYLGFSSNTSKSLQKSLCHPLCDCETCQNDQEFDFDFLQKPSQIININTCNVTGYTPLHVASKYGRTDILRLLLDCGAMPNSTTYKTFYTPLHLACIYQRIQIVRELLKCGNCKIDEQDVNGNTPLYYACAKNDVKIVEILLSNGANCNIKNYTGRSVLQECEENVQYRVINLLKNSLRRGSSQSSIAIATPAAGDSDLF